MPTMGLQTISSSRSLAAPTLTTPVGPLDFWAMSSSNTTPVVAATDSRPSQSAASAVQTIKALWFVPVLSWLSLIILMVLLQDYLFPSWAVFVSFAISSLALLFAWKAIRDVRHIHPMLVWWFAVLAVPAALSLATMCFMVFLLFNWTSGGSPYR